MIKKNHINFMWLSRLLHVRCTRRGAEYGNARAARGRGESFIQGNTIFLILYIFLFFFLFKDAEEEYIFISFILHFHSRNHNLLKYFYSFFPRGWGGKIYFFSFVFPSRKDNLRVYLNWKGNEIIKSLPSYLFGSNRNMKEVFPSCPSAWCLKEKDLVICL